MLKQDINNKPYDEATQLKLNIFRKCFREWFPVFVYNKTVNNIYIYDMFAGSGTDTEGRLGSPLILLEEAIGDNGKYCEQICKETNKTVIFGFNEKKQEKENLLKDTIAKKYAECKTSCVLENCVYSKNTYVHAAPFSEILNSAKFDHILADKHSAKFILLDQYGFSQITNDVFLKLVKSHTTDFIFFISSSFIKRFKEQAAVSKYFDTQKIKFEESRPNECHRIIADYFRNLLPNNIEYYINHFTIRKHSNYYGLIFGTSHSLGMEKFVKVCWQEDPLSGESNCNINNDFERDSLFYNSEETSKKSRIKELVESKIILGEFVNNVEGLKWVLSQGCEPKLFVEVINNLLKANKIEIEGRFNRQSSNIHRAAIYNIRTR